jgi:glutaredoxin 3
MSLTEYNRSYRPFSYPWAVEYATQSEKMHWIEAEAELQDDVKQWKGGKLSDVEKNHITQIFRLFTQSDVQVASNDYDYFLPYFKNNEIRMMLGSFAAREGIHIRAYALLMDTLGMDESEYSAFLSDPDMRSKMEFMQSNEFAAAVITDDEASVDMLRRIQMGYLLAKAVCNEGMSLFSAFAMLMSYQRYGKMKGMCKIVEWSIKDEALHVDGFTRLFREFCTEHPEIVTDELKKYIYDLYRHAVELEDKIIDIAFAQGDIEGLTSEQMKIYIRYIADRRLIDLGLKANYEIKENPLPWLDWIISGNNLTNFFEQRVADYTVAGLVGDWGWT